MAVLIDQPVWPWKGRLWCHMVSDTSYDELHTLAQAAGIPRRVFQGDHYDIPEEYRADMIALGAQEVSSRELLIRLKAAGLRISRENRRTHPGVS